MTIKITENSQAMDESGNYRCPDCGGIVPEAANFCSDCGKRVEWIKQPPVNPFFESQVMLKGECPFCGKSISIGIYKPIIDRTEEGQWLVTISADEKCPWCGEKIKSSVTINC